MSVACGLVPGENKIHFIPGMIGPFLGVTLVPQVEVRNIMIPIFHDMMDWEQRKNGNFKQVQKRTQSMNLYDFFIRWICVGVSFPCGAIICEFVVSYCKDRCECVLKELNSFSR